MAPVPELTAVRLVSAWQWEPGILAVVGLLAAGYAVGLRRAARVRHDRWPPARSWCFGLGLGTVLLVGCSFLGVYDDTLFWVRAVQNILLLMVAPMLLAAGAPLTLLAESLPSAWRRRSSVVLHSRAAVLGTLPPVVTVLLVVPILVLYTSPLYEATLRSAVVSGVCGTALVLCGAVYFWTRFRIDPTPRAGSHLVTLWITIVEMVGDAVLGVVLWLGPLVAAGFYTALARDWGPSLRTDQLLGAGVLWIGGDVVGLPFIGVVVVRMMREDTARARQVDAELDAADVVRAAAPEPAPSRLWWEDDPQIADRFRRR